MKIAVPATTPPLTGGDDPRLTVPSRMLPSKKLTVPVAADGETTAVNATVCPYDDGLMLENSVIVVPKLVPIVCRTTFDVLGL